MKIEGWKYRCAVAAVGVTAATLSGCFGRWYYVWAKARFQSDLDKLLFEDLRPYILGGIAGAMFALTGLSIVSFIVIARRLNTTRNGAVTHC